MKKEIERVICRGDDGQIYTVVIFELVNSFRGTLGRGPVDAHLAGEDTAVTIQDDPNEFRLNSGLILRRL